ncbi:lectin-like domain-containing protein, partial [Staphylococcus warneri]
MSKRQRNLKHSLEEEKSRVKLYKSGKHWIKSGIKEIKLMQIMGLPIFSNHTSEGPDETQDKGNFVKRNAIKATTIAGGAFTVNMLHNHQAMAASELPITSELSTQSEAVANQNSTELKHASTNENPSNSESVSSEKTQSSEKNDNADSTQSTDSQSDQSNTQSSESVKDQTEQQSESDQSHNDSHSEQSSKQDQSEHNSTTSSESDSKDAKSTASSTNDKSTDAQSQKSTSNSQDQQQSTSSESKVDTNEGQSQKPTQSKDSQTPNNATTSESSSNQNNIVKSESITNQTSYVNERMTHAASESVVTTPVASESTKPANTTKVRAFSRLAVNRLAAAATPTPIAPTTSQVVVDKNNFTDHFTTVGSATFDKNTGIATLTPDASSQKGAISLGTKINSNKSFHFTGKVNLGTRYEGFSPDGVTGGDGIGFAFSPGTLGQIGKEGAALGIGGLNNAFGFKLDSYHNTSQPNASASANKDPANVSGGGAFGAFVTTNSSGVASTYTDSTKTANAAKLTTQPNGTFQDFVIDYNGDTKVMTVTYAGQTWTRNISDWIKASNNTNFSLSMTASTGGARNLQQVQIDSFTYTESATAQVHYVDANTGKEIIPPKTLAGDVDNTVNIDDQQSTITPKGYQLVNVDSTYAPTYNATNKTVKLTNAGQAITIFYKDVKAPTINMTNQTKEINSPITPITVNSTDNGTGTVTNTVTGLPAGLSYDSTSNTITGTPTQLGNNTVTVTSVDQAGNSSSSTFTINVVDTTNPVIDIGNQSNQVFTPINNVTINTSDNSGSTTDTVTGLPPGLTYDPSTKTVSGTPSQLGSYTVTVTSKDASNNTTTKTFTWNIERNAASDSLSNSQSTSTITSTSTSNSTSNSNSISASNSTSTSLSDSKSNSLSASTSTSASTSDSTSASLSGSQSASTSASTSSKLSDSASASTSASDSTSSSTSASDSASTSSSTSASLSGSQSASTSASTSSKLSDSASASTSASDSTSSST